MKLTLDTLRYYCTCDGDCLIWNQTINSSGYPTATLEGKPGQSVRTYVYRNLLGKKLNHPMVVASRCGDKRCVNPDHLVRRTRSDIQREVYASGRRNAATEYLARFNGYGRHVLDWAKVHDIRSRPTHQTHSSIAAELGVSRRCIQDVRMGRTWRQAADRSSVFSMAQSGSLSG